MIKNYLKIAWRNLLRNKISSFINIFGLTISLCVCVTLLIFVEYERSFDTYHTKAENTFRVVQHNAMPNETLYWNTTAYPLAAALRNDLPEIAAVTQIAGPVKRTFKVGDDTNQLLFEEPKVLFVDPEYPHIFDVEWLAGDKNSALNHPDSAVLTADLALNYFGVQNNYQTVLGKTVVLQSKDPLTVTGVVKNPPGNSDHQYKMLIPYEFFKINNPYFSSNWSGNYQGTTYVRLASSVNLNTLESKINTWKKKYLNAQDNQRISYHLQPLTNIHNETRYGASPGGYIMPKRTLVISMAAAFFVLLLAIINFINLVTAQAHSKSKEVGVRKVMGSNRLQLTLRFIYEHGLLIAVSAFLSIFLVVAALKFLNDNLPIIDLQLAFEWRHLVLVLAIACITVAAATIYPSLVLSGRNPIKSLKNQFQNTSGTTTKTRKGLVTFQFVIVQLFVIAVIILASQMSYFKSNNLGFLKDAVLITETHDFKKNQVFKEKLLSNGTVEKIAFGSGPPMAVNGFQLGTRFRLPNQAETESLNAEMKIGDVNYLDFYDLELIAGRNFYQNKEAFDEFIVNETLLKTYGWTPEEAIGKELQINEGKATIVGVVKDFHNNALKDAISPCILLNWVYWQNNAFIRLGHLNPTSLGSIKENWEETFTNGIYKFQFLDDAIAKEYTLENIIFNGFKIFSILAIILGCLGLFGMMSFVVAQKRKEISIRKVLGATLQQNIALFSKEYMGLVLLAFAVATPIAYYFMNQWLQSFTYRIELSIWMFLTGGLVTLLIAFATCSYQSIKAAMANPIKSLRTE